MLELRALGVGFIIADQSANNIPAEIFDLCASKTFLGASPYSGIAEYRDRLGIGESTLSMLHLLRAGDGFFCNIDLERPLFFHSDNVIDTLGLSEPYNRRNDFFERNPMLAVRNLQACLSCPKRHECTPALVEEAEVHARFLIPDLGADLTAAARIGQREAVRRQLLRL